MGREIKRVALDFNWPLNKVWKGFLNPFGGVCPENEKTCFNGESSGSAWLTSILRLLGVAADDAIRGVESRKRGQNFPHPYLVNLENAPTHSIPRPENDSEEAKRAYFVEWGKRARDRQNWVLPPSKDLAELLSKLSTRQQLLGFMDVGWEIRKLLLSAAGMTDKWGVCPVCDGKGDDPAKRAEYEAWKETPPPEGPGWQLWETVSEGSPVSPVFETREAFVQYLIGRGSTPSAAEAFTEMGWTPSGVLVPGKGFVSGIEVAEAMSEK